MAKSSVLAVPWRQNIPGTTLFKQPLSRFRDFFPEHGDKQLYGILAAVDWSEAVKAQAIAEGLYVARIHDDVFDLEVAPDFQPRAF